MSEEVLFYFIRERECCDDILDELASSWGGHSTSYTRGASEDSTTDLKISLGL
jgi:hypothetical protein